MSAVRLWRWRDGDYHRSGATPNPTHIALHAAEHAALVALLVEARGALSAKVGGHHFRAGEPTGFSEDGMDITYGPDVHIAECPGCRSQDARDSLLARIDAALAGQEGGAK